MRALLFFLLFCTALAAAGAEPGPDSAVRVAVLAVKGEERAAQDFEPTIRHLEASLGGRTVTMMPLDLAGIERAVTDGTVDFVVTNPGQYVELEARLGVTRLATLESRNHAVPTDSVGSTVVTLDKPGHPRTLRDLAGRRLAIVSPQAFGGWRVVAGALDAEGLQPTDLAALVETGFPMDLVLTALRENRADAGVLRACMLEEAIARGEVAPDAFAVVGDRPVAGFPCRLSSRLYPDWPFARLAATSPDLAKAVTAALLQMTPVDGRAWTAPQDYTSVHDLFRQLKIGPYAYLAHTSLGDIAWANRHWLLAGALVVGWWIVHVARVEVLVRRRTAELTREIQERTRAEEEARRTREQRDQYSRLGILGEMASTLAHELNQPLAAITNYAEGLTRIIDSGRADPAFLRDGARGIAGQAERAATIIQRVRAFVRRREARRERLDIDDVIDETLHLFETLAARRGIPLRRTRGVALPQVMADRNEIGQVLLNLLQNAVDAMLEGGARDLGIEIATRSVDGAVEVEIRDHGPGLAADVEARLFETFFTTKPEGLGLGLSICRTIVESHGGRLWAESQPGGGLAMRFALPALKDLRT